jgi:hypothetical protein
MQPARTSKTDISFKRPMPELSVGSYVCGLLTGTASIALRHHDRPQSVLLQRRAPARPSAPNLADEILFALSLLLQTQRSLHLELFALLH